jgi:hypothetical protein
VGDQRGRICWITVPVEFGPETLVPERDGLGMRCSRLITIASSSLCSAIRIIHQEDVRKIFFGNKFLELRQRYIGDHSFCGLMDFFKKVSMANTKRNDLLLQGLLGVLVSMVTEYHFARLIGQPICDLTSCKRVRGLAT